MYLAPSADAGATAACTRRTASARTSASGCTRLAFTPANSVTEIPASASIDRVSRISATLISPAGVANPTATQASPRARHDEASSGEKPAGSDGTSPLAMPSANGRDQPAALVVVDISFSSGISFHSDRGARPAFRSYYGYNGGGGCGSSS